MYLSLEYPASAFFLNFTRIKKIENCSLDASMNRDNCKYTSLYKKLMKEVNCTVPWITNKSNICKNHTLAKKAMEIYDLNKQNTERDCPTFCTTFDVFLDPPSIDNYWFGNSTAAIKFYFRDKIKNSEEYYLQNELSLFANIGGLLGLMLGISLVNVRDLINKSVEYI